METKVRMVGNGELGRVVGGGRAESKALRMRCCVTRCDWRRSARANGVRNGRLMCRIILAGQGGFVIPGGKGEAEAAAEVRVELTRRWCCGGYGEGLIVSL